MLLFPPVPSERASTAAQLLQLFLTIFDLVSEFPSIQVVPGVFHGSKPCCCLLAGI